MNTNRNLYFKRILRLILYSLLIASVIKCSSTPDVREQRISITDICYTSLFNNDTQLTSDSYDVVAIEHDYTYSLIKKQDAQKILDWKKIQSYDELEEWLRHSKNTCNAIRNQTYDTDDLKKMFPLIPYINGFAANAKNPYLKKGSERNKLGSEACKKYEDFVREEKLKYGEQVRCSPQKIIDKSFDWKSNIEKPLTYEIECNCNVAGRGSVKETTSATCGIEFKTPSDSCYIYTPETSIARQYRIAENDRREARRARAEDNARNKSNQRSNCMNSCAQFCYAGNQQGMACLRCTLACDQN